MANGNGKINYPLIVSIVIAVIAISGLVIGQYQSQASMSDKYVLKEQYRCDINRIETKMDKIMEYIISRDGGRR